MTNKFEVRYSLEFFEELDAIILYIKNELKNNIAANKLVEKVENEIAKRQESPKSYKQYKTNGGYTYYRIYVDKYIIFYTVTDNIMEVRNIRYYRRNFNKLI